MQKTIFWDYWKSTCQKKKKKSGLQKIIPKLYDLIVLRNSLILPLWSPHLGD